MAKKEIRLTFNEKELDLYDFLCKKSSKTAYVKDLLRLHMNIEDSYMANGLTVATVPTTQEKKQDEYDFDITDLGF